MAPTATEEKLAEKIQGVADNLADFRVEVAERFGALPRACWPNLLTRVGLASLLLSFALLICGCYYMLVSVGE